MFLVSLMSIHVHQWAHCLFSDCGLRASQGPRDVFVRWAFWTAGQGSGGCIGECGIFGATGGIRGCSDSDGIGGFSGKGCIHRFYGSRGVGETGGSGRFCGRDFLESVHSVISGNGDIGGAPGTRGISGINGANTIVVLV